MTRVIFVGADGARTEIDAAPDRSLMQAALAAQIPGIVAECGGEMVCATCHVYVDPDWVAALPPRPDAEEDMLEFASEEPTDCSRLSCQIRLGDALDGLTVTVPATQR